MPQIGLCEIKPTQLFISEEKLHNAQALFDEKGYDSYDPVPVKHIGNELFFTDGHTRALVLWRNGIREIETFEDTDDMDWIAYLVDLKWCREVGISSIADLDDRVVSAEDYQRLWRDRCSEKHDVLAAAPLTDLEISFESDTGVKQSTCNEVLRSLPQWFGIEEAIVDYVEGVRNLPFVTLRLYGTVVGFCALKIHYEINCELYVLGMYKEFHRRGIGKRMVAFIEDYCIQNNLPLLTVKTLSARHPDAGYARTRMFYESCGFRSFEEFPTLWGTENPCLYMLKQVPSVPS